MLAAQEVYVHLLEKSIFLNAEEKQAIKTGQLVEHLNAARAQDRVFEVATSGVDGELKSPVGEVISGEEDRKQEDSLVAARPPQLLEGNGG